MDFNGIRLRKRYLIMQKEDKLKKKAIDVHRKSCPQWNCCKHRLGKPTCTKECEYIEKFILLLNN